MNTRRSPMEIAEAMMSRSVCTIQVGACIVDKNDRIISWGWNSSGSGYGIHAEAHAVQRANRSRLRGSTIYVASQRKRPENVIYSRPCSDCQLLLKGVGIQAAWWRDKFGWHWELTT